MTPLELIKMIKEAISYGDDPFLDSFSELLDKLEKTTDEEEKKILKELVELYLILEKIILNLSYHHERSEHLKYYEY